MPPGSFFVSVSKIVDRRSHGRCGPPSLREGESKEPMRKRRWKDPLLRSLHQDERAREEFMLGLNKIARHGARKILAEALEAEVQAYVEAARGEPNDEEHAPVHEKRLHHGARDLCGAGAVEVKAPRVNERRVDEASNRKRFESVILSPYMRRSPKVTA
jgi:transposase-like protein